MDNEKKVEKLVLEDGRVAERHVYTDVEGNEVVEMYAEPQKSLSLNRRIVNKVKPVLVEQVIETIKDGEVVDREVHSTEAPVKMQLREHIKRYDRPVASETVTQEQIANIVAQTVSQTLEAQAAVKQEPEIYTEAPMPPVIKIQSVQPKQAVFSAQSVVAERVEEKKSSDLWTVLAIGFSVILQIAAVVWYLV